MNRLNHITGQRAGARNALPDSTPPAMPGTPRRLSPRQEKLYWREWGKARRALLAMGWTREEADEERKLRTIDALGADIPHASFTNAQLDTMLDEWRRLSDPDDLQLGKESGKRRRLLHGIGEIERTRPAYVAEICTDCFGHTDWRKLEDGDLIKLRSTLARRVERPRKSRGVPAGIAPDGTVQTAEAAGCSARDWLLNHFRGTKMADWPVLASDDECEAKRAQIERTRSFLADFPTNEEGAV